MKTKIRKCIYCNIYTLKDICPKCGRETVSIAPPHYSPLDKYGKYRREFKKMEAEKNG